MKTNTHEKVRHFSFRHDCYSDAYSRICCLFFCRETYKTAYEDARSAWLAENSKKNPDKLLLQKLNTAMKSAETAWSARGKKVKQRD